MDKVTKLIRMVRNNSEILTRDEIEKDESDRAFVIRDNQGIFFKDNKTFENYLKLQDELYNDEKIAKNYTKKELKNNLVDKLVYNQGSSEDIYNELLNVEEHNIQYYIPITPSQLSEIYHLNDITLFPINEITTQIDENLKGYIEEENIKVLANITVETSSEKRGKEIASRRVKNLLYIFRIFSFSLSGKRNLSVDDNITNNSMAIIKTPEKETLSLSKIGALLPLKLDVFLNSSNRYFDQLVKIVNQNYERNDIQLRIFESMQWVGEGLGYIETNDKFTRIMIGIESLLEQKNEGNITEKMAERVAFLTEKDKKSRLEKYRLFQDLYAKRSTLVHGSKINVGLYDLKKIMEIYKDILFWFIDNSTKIKNNQNLNEYINRVKFG